MKRILSIAVAVLVAATLTPSAAHASEDLHPDVEYALDAVPGGIAVNESTVVWPELGMTLTTGATIARGVGNCATGTYCAYSGSGMGGSKLTFSVCTNVSSTDVGLGTTNLRCTL